MKYMLIYLCFINILAIIVCFADKRAAVSHRRRVPEARLFTLAFIGGSLGLFLGMQLFRHKTRHISFIIGIPIMLVLQIVAIVWLFNYTKIFL